MKIGFNGASTMKTDLPGDIRAASRAGYDLIEIWAKKMEAYLLDHSLDDLRTLLTEAHVKPLAINSVEFITFNAPWEKTNTMNLIAQIRQDGGSPGLPLYRARPEPQARRRDRQGSPRRIGQGAAGRSPTDSRSTGSGLHSSSWVSAGVPFRPWKRTLRSSRR